MRVWNKSLYIYIIVLALVSDWLIRRFWITTSALVGTIESPNFDRYLLTSFKKERLKRIDSNIKIFAGIQSIRYTNQYDGWTSVECIIFAVLAKQSVPGEFDNQLPPPGLLAPAQDAVKVRERITQEIYSRLYVGIGNPLPISMQEPMVIILLWK